MLFRYAIRLNPRREEMISQIFESFDEAYTRMRATLETCKHKGWTGRVIVVRKAKCSV